MMHLALTIFSLGALAAAGSSPQYSGNAGQINIAEFERKSLETLHAYSQKPDCFRRAANSVRSQCAALDMDEDSRVAVAIKMTLCEIGTAQHYSIPSECRPFLSGTKGPSASTAIRRACVDALSRSAQFWSSYSGYFREVVQLCHAYQRWNDVDLARDIYKNISSEKLLFLQVVKEHEEELLRTLHEWKAPLANAKDIVSNFVGLAEKFGRLPDSISVSLSKQVDLLGEMFGHSLYSHVEHHKQRAEKLSEELRGNLGHVVEIHTEQLSALSNNLTAGLSKAVDLTHREVEKHIGDWRKEQLELKVGLADLFSDMSAASKIAHQFYEQALVTQGLLLHMSENANSLHQQQEAAILAAFGLGNRLKSLILTADDHLTSFNASALLIQQQIYNLTQSSRLSTMGGLSHRVLTTVLSGETLSLLGPRGWVSLSQLGVAVLDLALNLIWAVLSACISVLVFLLVSTRRIIWKPSMLGSTSRGLDEAEDYGAMSFFVSAYATPSSAHCDDSLIPYRLWCPAEDE